MAGFRSVIYVITLAKSKPHGQKHDHHVAIKTAIWLFLQIPLQVKRSRKLPKKKIWLKPGFLNFYTIFGSKPSYANWQPGEPNNGEGSENCGHLGNEHGQWNDIRCERLFPFICQKQKCKLIFIFISTFGSIRNGNSIPNLFQFSS